MNYFHNEQDKKQFIFYLVFQNKKLYLCFMEKTKVKSGTLVVEADDLYTISEYAKKLGVTPPTVRYRMLIGKLKRVDINGLTLIVREK